jgi:hypothetical protein
LFFFISTHICADEQEIRMLLARPFVKAEFEKVRKLKILSRPFVTSGRIIFLPEKGLVWQTLQPIEDTLLIGLEGVSQFKKDKPKPEKIDNPVVKSASQVFITLLSLDLEKIKTIFSIKEQAGDTEIKTYILTPKDETLKKIIDHITMSGKLRVKKIYIEEKSGDSTLVTLKNETFDKSALSPAELDLLEMM